MAGLVPAIHVFASTAEERRGCQGQGERKRRRPSDGYARAWRGTESTEFLLTLVAFW